MEAVLCRWGTPRAARCPRCPRSRPPRPRSGGSASVMRRLEGEPIGEQQVRGSRSTPRRETDVGRRSGGATATNAVPLDPGHRGPQLVGGCVERVPPIGADSHPVTFAQHAQRRGSVVRAPRRAPSRRYPRWSHTRPGEDRWLDGGTTRARRVAHARVRGGWTPVAVTETRDSATRSWSRRTASSGRSAPTTSRSTASSKASKRTSAVGAARGRPGDVRRPGDGAHELALLRRPPHDPQPGRRRGSRAGDLPQGLPGLRRLRGGHQPQGLALPHPHQHLHQLVPGQAAPARRDRARRGRGPLPLPPARRARGGPQRAAAPRTS